MKQNLLKTWLVMLCMLVGIGSAWAGDVTVSKTMSAVVSENEYTVSSGSTINTKCTSIDLDDNINVSLSCSDGNSGSFWGSAPNIDWRLYQATSPSITLTANNSCTIKSVKFTYTKNNTGVINTIGCGKSISNSKDQINSGQSYDVNATTVTYYVGNSGSASNGQARITAIEVVYSSDGGEVTPPATQQYSYTLETIGSGTTTFKDANNNEVKPGDKVDSGTKITPTFTPADGYEFTSWEYYTTAGAWSKLTGNDFTISKDVQFRVTFTAVGGDDPTPGEGNSETYTFSSFTQGNDVTLESTNYTIDLHKNTGSTAPQWNANSNEARVYAKGSVVVTSEKNIVKIVYDYVLNAGGKNSTPPTVDGAKGATTAGTWDADAKTWTGKDKEITLSTSGSAGNLGFKSITVYFEEESTPVVPTYASLDELIDANLEETTVVNVTINDEVAMAMANPMSGAYMVSLKNSEVTLAAPGSDLGWKNGGIVTGTLENVTWDPINYALTSETNFWSSLEYDYAGPSYDGTIDFVAAGKDGYYATFCNDEAVTIPYAIEVENDEYVLFSVYSVYAVGNMLELQDLTEGLTYNGQIWLSENEGYLIKAESTSEEYTFTGETAISVGYTNVGYDLYGQDEDNALRPSSEPMSADKKNYKLAYKSGTNQNPATLGFYWGAENGGTFAVRDNSAYLALPKETLAKGFSFVDIEATGIKNVNTPAVGTNAMYNLAGQRVNKNAKGIVIVNGKKMLNK